MPRSTPAPRDAEPPADAEAILRQLRLVDDERQWRARSIDVTTAIRAVKSYQQRRFSKTYADLLSAERYAGVTHFFLTELYGPTDFSERDAQFAKVVPTLVRLFPQEIVDAVATLATLHALSESLDSRMAETLELTPERRMDARAYVAAWQAVGRTADRQRQIDLTLHVAATLDRLTRKPMLRTTLRLMRSPARAAGLGELQRFLENGFDTFQAMKGAHEFIAIVRSREQSLAARLFDIENATVHAEIDLPAAAIDGSSEAPT